MNYKSFETNSYQIFYVSQEISHCPLASEFTRFGKKWSEQPVFIDSTCILSLKFGKRLLINSNQTDFRNIQPEDLVEIVDYDPLKNIALVIGKNEPSVETPVHWIIQNAREDINAILQLENQRLAQQSADKYPQAIKERPEKILDHAKGILKTIRMSKHIILKNQGIMLSGIHLQEIEESLAEILEVFDED